MMNIDDDFERKVKTSLDADVKGLDADTRQQLAVARRTALSQPNKQSWRDSWLKISWLTNYGLPAGSLAICSLLAVFFLASPKPSLVPANVVINSAIQLNDQVAALELMDNADDIDTATDPDFYLWADEVLATEGKAHAA